MPRKKEEEQFMETAPMASATQTQTQVVSITRTKMGIAVAFLGFAAVAAAAAGGLSSSTCTPPEGHPNISNGSVIACAGEKLFYNKTSDPLHVAVLAVRSFNNSSFSFRVDEKDVSGLFYIPGKYYTVAKGETINFSYTYSPNYVEEFSITYTGFNKSKNQVRFLIDSQTVATCTDSDGGLDYGVKGVVTEVTDTTNVQTNTDYCSTNSTIGVIEYTCMGDIASSTYYNCYTEGKICQDGACVVSSTIPTTSTPATSTFSNDAILKVEKVTTDNNIKLLNGVQQKIATFGFLSLYNDTKIFGLSLEKEVTGSCSFSNWTLKDNDIVKGGDFLISESDSLVNSYYVYFEDVDQYIFPANIPKVLSVYADVNNISAGEECIIKLTMQPNTSFATYAKEVKGLPLYVVRTN